MYRAVEIRKRLKTSNEMEIHLKNIDNFVRSTFFLNHKLYNTRMIINYENNLFVKQVVFNFMLILYFES